MPGIKEIIARTGSPARRSSKPPSSTNTQQTDDSVATDLMILRNSIELQMRARERMIQSFYVAPHHEDDDEEAGFADCQF